jgi:hypothetical protein
MPGAHKLTYNSLGGNLGENDANPIFAITAARETVTHWIIKGRAEVSFIASNTGPKSAQPTSADQLTRPPLTLRGSPPARGPQRGAALSGDVDRELQEHRRVIALDHLETIPARDVPIGDLTIRGVTDYVPDPIEPAHVPGLAVFVP